MEATNDSLSNIRQKLRLEDQLLRIQSRSQKLSARRKNFVEFSQKLKVPSHDEFQALSSSLSIKKDLETVNQITLALSVGEEYISAFLQTEGALYALVGAFTGRDSAVKIAAGNALINLGLGSEAECLQVCEKIGAYLVTNMNGSNPLLQDMSAWCYGNLCGSHEKVCHLAQKQGLEEELLKLLSSHFPNVLQSAAYALNHYLSTVPNRLMSLANSKVVHLLIGGIKKDDEYISEVGWCLFLLSTERQLCEMMVDQGIVLAAVSALYGLIQEQNLNVQSVTPLVRILLNCVAAVPGTAVEICYQSEQIISVVTALLYGRSPHLRSESLQLIANIVNSVDSLSHTGQTILQDTNLKAHLQPALNHALASHFRSVIKS